MARRGWQDKDKRPPDYEGGIRRNPDPEINRGNPPPGPPGYQVHDYGTQGWNSAFEALNPGRTVAPIQQRYSVPDKQAAAWMKWLETRKKLYGY